MDAVTLATLAALALVDSTSVGTLLIPLWMLLRPDLRPSRFLLYLATLAAFYAAVGVLLLTGAGSLQRALPPGGAGEGLDWGQLLLGAALVVTGLRVDPRPATEGRVRPWRTGRLERWRDRASGGSAGAVVSLALVAGGLELATMLPYLAAVGLVSTAGPGALQGVLLLLAYVVVMVLPALGLLAVRLVARRRVEPLLRRLGSWASRSASGALGWALGAVGVLLVVDAAVRLAILPSAWLGPAGGPG